MIKTYSENTLTVQKLSMSTVKCVFNIVLAERITLLGSVHEYYWTSLKNRVRKTAESSNADFLFFCNICFIQSDCQKSSLTFMDLSDFFAKRHLGRQVRVIEII